jgi:hypothetical protein
MFGEIIIWILGIAIGLGFCIFMITIPYMVEYFDDMRYDRNPTISKIGWVMWIVYKIIYAIAIIVGTLCMISMAKDAARSTFHDD